MKLKLIFLSLFGIIVLLACSKKETTYTIETIDGVNYITNNALQWGDEQKITLEFVRKIGEMDAEDKHYLLFRPRDCVRDSKGNNYILHDGDHHIFKYDPDWKFITSFGGKGQGPGEIAGSYGLAMDHNDILYVIDHRNMRVQKFDGEGNPVGGFPLPRQTFMASIQKSGDVILSGQSFAFQNLSKVTDFKLLIKVDSKGKIIKHFVDAKKFDSPMSLYRVNELSFEIDEEDYIYVTFEYLNRIEKYSPDSELIYSMSRPLNYQIGHKEVMRKYNVEGQVREYPDMDMSYVSYFIDIDPQRRLWVQTYNKQPKDKGSGSSSVEEEGIFDFEIFSNDGILLTRVPAPTRFYKFRIYGDMLYLIDPYHEMCVYVYRIVEKN